MYSVYQVKEKGAEMFARQSELKVAIELACRNLSHDGVWMTFIICDGSITHQFIKRYGV